MNYIEYFRVNRTKNYGLSYSASTGSAISVDNLAYFKNNCRKEIYSGLDQIIKAMLFCYCLVIFNY